MSAMTIEKMTTKAHEAMRTAMTGAGRSGNPEIHPEHITLALVEQKDGIVVPLIEKAGGNVTRFSDALGKRLKSFPKQEGGSEARLSARSTAMLRAAEDQAKKLKDDYVSTEHILLGAAKIDPRGARCPQ